MEKSAFAKTLRTIDLLEIFEHRLGMPHSKKVDEKLFELRVHGKQEVRIFYSFFAGEAILLHGFIKKSARIPLRELKIALQKLRRLTGT